MSRNAWPCSLPLGGQAVELLGGGQLDGLHDRVGRGAADDEGEVVGRAGRGAERLHLGDQVVEQLLGGEQRLGLLVEHGLVGGAAALGDEEELVGVTLGGVEVDLRRQVGAGVLLLVHVERDGLGVAQVLLGVGLVDALGDVFLVVDAGPDLLALLGDDGGGAGVLAGRQLELGGDHGVAQEGHGDALVVARGFRVGQDLGDLLVVFLAQQEGDVLHGGVGQDGDRLGADPQHFLAGKVVNADIFFRTGNLVVLGFVLGNGIRVLIGEFRHDLSPLERHEIFAPGSLNPGWKPIPKYSETVYSCR